MKKIILLAAVWFTTLSGQAQIPAPTPDTYVNDFTRTLSPEQIRILNDSILSIEKRTSVQIAVLIIPNLPPNIEIEDYAREVGNEWKVGLAHNGIVYVASIKEHKQRLEVAQNLEGDVPDVEALHITDDLKPYLRQQDYAGAVGILIKEINDRVDPAAKEQLKLAAAERKKKDALLLRSILVGLCFMGGLWLLVVWIYRVFFLPGIRKRKQHEEDERLANEIKEAKELNEKRDKQEKEHAAWLLTAAGVAWTLDQNKKQKLEAEERKKRKKDNDDDSDSYKSSSYKSSSRDDGYSSGSSSSSYGGFGSSGGGGFSGGGASNSW